MRHSRAEQFAAALESMPDQKDLIGHWSDVAADPNDPAAIAHRAAVLRRAWRPAVTDRVRFLEDRCRGRRVLDIGCVAHDIARADTSQWLHARLAAVSETCLGVDVIQDAVDELKRRGYEVICQDLTTGLGPLDGMSPFDVIVAGELIEHLESLDMLFRVATQALDEQGELVMTTPNPYAPRRVRAGQRGIVWENVDHVSYLFPSGIAELAERYGLVLEEARTVNTARPRLHPRLLAARLRRRLRGSQWASVGISTTGPLRTRRLDLGPIGLWLEQALRPGQLLGETFLYVVRRTPSA